MRDWDLDRWIDWMLAIVITGLAVGTVAGMILALAAFTIWLLQGTPQ